MNIVFLEANTLGEDVDLSMFEKFGEVITYPISDPVKNAERCGEADVVVLILDPVMGYNAGQAHCGQDP